ncbi:MAG: gamma-glutamyl-gamma-aminobutyrate hydrolase family protein [Acidimicrobiales bacterium]|nr:gamma-glutamyl-gamma-aminobutyrate hydrolase family protein [Acidimicrobiales bacterium]MYH75685.1 gamma-glutamyl-gamma-aminobutyrate hydrolase family protein [Acidimicrobiales bacterium]MYK70740.1 gamma-glutamyl-gamma-aminobutyrate hydrolase family protein [Acidimicrobiales bacterium]
MPKPLIGLSGRRRAGARIRGFPPVFVDVEVDLYIAHYAQAVHAAGAVALHVPLDADPADVVPRLDGVLLTGGEDVAACLYADRLHEQVYDGIDPFAERAAGFDNDRGASNSPADSVPLRDAFEIALLDAAVGAGLPVLGICRGPQLINIAAGGTLHQHLPEHAATDGPPDATPHTVTTTEGSQLRQMYGPEVAVNSLHHQAVDQLGEGYIATAHSPDGIIEGMEHTELPIIAVQWHPELMTGALEDPCFRWLVEHASR